MNLGAEQAFGPWQPSVLVPIHLCLPHLSTHGNGCQVARSSSYPSWFVPLFIHLFVSEWFPAGCNPCEGQVLNPQYRSPPTQPVSSLPWAGPASTVFCKLHSQQQHTGAPGSAKKKAPGVVLFLDLFITSCLNIDIFLKLGQEDWIFFFFTLYLMEEQPSTFNIFQMYSELPFKACSYRGSCSQRPCSTERKLRLWAAVPHLLSHSCGGTDRPGGWRQDGGSSCLSPGSLKP